MYDIYYFSGTGNTKAVGELLKEKLNCNMYSIEDCPYIYSNFILMFPIHGFGAPALVLDWINSLPYSDKKVVIITTAADFISLNKSATQRAIKMLEIKGYHVCYDRIVVMPPNFVMSYPDEFAKQLYEIAKIKVNHIIKELDNNIKRRYNNSVYTKIIRPIYFGESKIASKAFGKSLSTNEACTKCLICVKLCPCDNIEMTDDNIIFNDKCMMCMRCVYSCPEKAIESSNAEFTILSKGYNLEKLLNKTTDNEYVTDKTKGYYKHFIQYIKDKSI